jgi:nicotinamide-nucleotide adenylyltransferase
MPLLLLYIPGWYNHIMKRFNRVGMVARWKPVHNGQALVLNALCGLAEEALIGIGSSNRYNVRNPFTLQETKDMLDILLEGNGNYELCAIPDLDDGPRWRALTLEIFGDLDCFVTDNPYVTNLLERDYRILRPVELLRPQDHIRVDGAMVRAMMARGEAWQAWVPEGVASYIQQNELDERFRREFGLETLALQTIID